MDLSNLLTSALDQVTDNVSLLDKDWRLVYVNAPANTVIDRLQTDREKLLGCVVWETLPELGDQLRDEYEKAMREQAPRHLEFYYERIDTWFDIRLFPSSTGLLTFSRDISKEKQESIRLLVQYKVAQLMTEQSDLRLLGQAILDLLLEHLMCQSAALWTVAEDEELRFWAATASDSAAEFSAALEQRRGTSLATRAQQAKSPVFGGAAELDEAITKARAGVGVPLCAGDRVWGVLELHSSHSGRDFRKLASIFDNVSAQLGQFLLNRHAEELIEEQTAWFEITLASIGDAVIATDTDGRITYLNRVAAELCGWTVPEAVGQPLDMVFRIKNEMTGEPVETPVAQVLREHRIVGLANHTVLIAKDGTERPIEDSAAPIRKPGGEVLGVVLVFHDASPRLRNQRALEESERRYRSIVETSYEGVWAVDAHYATTFVNNRMCQMLACTEEEMMSRPIWDFFFPEDLDQVRKIEEERRTKKLPSQYEQRLRRLDGYEIWALVSASPVLGSGGEFLGAFGLLTDITESKRYVEALRRNEERIRSLVEATSQAIWTANPQGEVIAHSPSWEKLTGQSELEHLGLGWLDALHAEDRDRVRASWLRAVQNRESFSEEYRLWSTKNQFIDVSARGVPVLSQNGDVVEWIVANTDISERVRAQAELKEQARLASFRSQYKDVFAVSTDLNQLLSALVDAAAQKLEIAAVGFWWREGAELVLRAQRGIPAGLGLQRVTMGVSELGKIAEAQRGHFTNSLQREADLPTEWISSQALVALVAQSIVSESETIGLMAAFSNRLLSANLIDEMKDLAEGVDYWVRRMKAAQEQLSLLESEQRARQEAEALLQLSAAFARETTQKGLVQTVTDAATQMTGAQFGAFFYNVVNTQGESYTLYTISGVPEENFSKFPMPRNTAVFHPTFVGEGTVLSQDITQDPRYGKNAPYSGLPEGHLPVRSYLAVSVRLRTGEILGGLFFGHPEPGRFQEHHARIAEAIAAHAAFAFERTPLISEHQPSSGS